MVPVRAHACAAAFAYSDISLQRPHELAAEHDLKPLGVQNGLWPNWCGLRNVDGPKPPLDLNKAQACFESLAITTVLAKISRVEDTWCCQPCRN